MTYTMKTAEMSAGEGGITLPLFSVFMSRVLLKYAYFLCFILSVCLI